MSLVERSAIIAEIDALSVRTGVRQTILISYLGLPRSTWNEWHERIGVETQHNHNTPKSNWLTPDETATAINFCAGYSDPFRGYRYLAWLMVDMGIAYIYPSTLYKLQKRNGLISKWAKPTKDHKEGYVQPTHPNEEWHTDYSYVRICGAFYYFACILDGFSRLILAWDFFDNMESVNIEILVTRAKELRPKANARIVHDNGRQFASKDFLELIAKLELKETATAPYHPQSNGKVERLHRTLKTEEVRVTPYVSKADAMTKMAKWIDFYCNERLHSAIGYLTPKEVFEGKKNQRIAKRKQKMYNANKKRQEYWRNSGTMAN